MAAVNSILQVENLTKSFGDLVLFENISFGLSEGQRVGLIAKNGSGKSTLLNILSGKEGYDGGTISFRRDIRVGYLEQDPQYPEELTVLEACFHHGNSTVELIKEYERCMETEGIPVWMKFWCAWTMRRPGSMSRKPNKFFPTQNPRFQSAGEVSVRRTIETCGACQYAYHRTRSPYIG